jgi:hypothetical protein
VTHRHLLWLTGVSREQLIISAVSSVRSRRLEGKCFVYYMNIREGSVYEKLDSVRTGTQKNRFTFAKIL